ncbi:hypothetical protein AOLI_G00291050 [Acnodon oligacanthus]
MCVSFLRQQCRMRAGAEPEGVWTQTQSDITAVLTSVPRSAERGERLSLNSSFTANREVQPKTSRNGKLRRRFSASSGPPQRGRSQDLQLEQLHATLDGLLGLNVHPCAMEASLWKRVLHAGSAPAFPHSPPSPRSRKCTRKTLEGKEVFMPDSKKGNPLAVLHLKRTVLGPLGCQKRGQEPSEWTQLLGNMGAVVSRAKALQVDGGWSGH